MVLSDGSRKYVWGLGFAYSVDTSGAISVGHADGLGSVRALTDGSGTLTQTYLTDPFGAVLATTGSSSQPFRFTGEQRDDTGLYYLRARFYDPVLGRFLSRDPFPGVRDAPASLHRYAYAANNPANLTDSSGLWWLWAGDYVVRTLAGSITELYDAAKTLSDPDATSSERLRASVLLGLATLGPVDGAGARPATNRALYHAYVAELRQQMSKPLVRDAELQGQLDFLYRAGATIRSGSTADAIRFTKETGQLVGGSDHLQKGRDGVRFLEKWLANNPEAHPGDQAAAENVLEDLRDALSR